MQSHEGAGEPGRDIQGGAGPLRDEPAARAALQAQGLLLQAYLRGAPPLLM